MFRLKKNLDGSSNKYKARLMAKGYHQVAGFDFKEVFNPLVKPQTIRVVLSIVVCKGWSLRQIDVNNVFLNGELKEKVFMDQSVGYIQQGQKHMVCKLEKSL